MNDKMNEVIELRKNKKPEEALVLLKSMLTAEPQNPDLLYLIAGTLDSLGKESEAAPYYEKALANGLQEDREGALLGLGSTYRCLGDYQNSIRILDQGVQEFPDSRPLKVFRSLTHYNLGRAEEAVSEMLVQLLDTTKDNEILSYERALRFYSDKLNETWKD